MPTESPVGKRNNSVESFGPDGPSDIAVEEVDPNATTDHNDELPSKED